MAERRGWSGAYVVDVDARSLELLCEDLGTPAANRKFNGVMHRVLGVAEQIRYCDRRANTFFDTPAKARYDAMKNPINCTWGFHRPPPLPESAAAACASTPAAALEARAAEVRRAWSAQPNSGIYAGYRGVQTWSTSDRVHDLYPKYINS